MRWFDRYCILIHHKLAPSGPSYVDLLHTLQVSEYDQYWVRREGGRVRVTRDVGGGAAEEDEERASRETTESAGGIVFPGKCSTVPVLIAIWVSVLQFVATVEKKSFFKFAET